MIKVPHEFCLLVYMHLKFVTLYDFFKSKYVSRLLYEYIFGVLLM
jgi:hypothetical protein